ncbi:MAG: class I SAM-dependent methyltransferase [Firmicutes bacterium]|nr:class I SAM-dependent methyltransferase [Candidatus Fermentithermobacillaceae bacterium]
MNTSSLDRRSWLKERRRLAEVRYDVVFSRDYDEKYGDISPTHRRFVEKLLSLTPTGARIIDAACGTGKYWRMILEAGRTVVGIDQSSEMLKLAALKHPEVPTEKVGLQEMTYVSEFSAAMCVDAMENVCPEDWPLVLGNLASALKKGGHLYLTVEVIAEEELEEAYRKAREMGLPVVFGEYAHHGGYHYYPRPEQTDEWLSGAGFETIEKALGDGYLHYLARKR